MISRLLSDDFPRSRLLAAILIVIVVGLAFAPFLFPGAKAMNVAARARIARLPIERHQGRAAAVPAR